jgi:CheY-like chemotaxis protein
LSDKPLHILLADDDFDDCLIFEEALKELPLPTCFTTVHDGEQLMRNLVRKTKPPVDVLFLDLNMPRKNGYECLVAIKNNADLKDIPVIIFSTTSESDIVAQLFDSGALHYIRKPSDFEKLKSVIRQALQIILGGATATHATLQRRFPNNDFILTAEL